MRITELRSSTRDGMWRCEADIQWGNAIRGSRTVYFEVPDAVSEGLKPTVEPFVLAAAVPALAAGEHEIVSDSEISPQLAADIRFCLKMLQTWNPRSLAAHPTPKIVAPVRTTPLTASSDRHAGQFFSGGVDAWYLLLTNRTDFPTEHPGRIAELIAIYGFDIGGRERDGDQRETFREFLATVKPATESLGLSMLPVYTNVRHLNDTPGFWGNLFAGFALVATAYLLRSSVAPLYIASPGDPLSPECQPPQGPHPLIPWALNNYELPVVMPYVDVSRLERVATVAANETAMSNLRVCFRSRSGALNCGTCEKCVRTQLELLIATGKKSHSCFAAPLTTESVDNIVIATTAASVFYYEMITALQQAGHKELVKAVNRRLATFQKHQRWLREEGVKGAIKRFDRSYMGGRLASSSSILRLACRFSRSRFYRLWDVGSTSRRSL